MTAAVLTRDWWLVGGLHGWRRATGILRAQLASAPLWAHLHPADAPALLVASEVAAFRDTSAVIRLGTLGSWVQCRVELTRWSHARCAISVTPLVQLPISAWWLPAEQYAAAPAMPCTAEA